MYAKLFKKSWISHIKSDKMMIIQRNAFNVHSVLCCLSKTSADIRTIQIKEEKQL